MRDQEILGFQPPGPAAASPPRYLYKYVTGARLDVLENAMIRFTQPSALNDPFEHAAKLEEIVRRRAGSPTTAKSFPALIKRLFAHAIGMTVGVSEPFIRRGWGDTHGALSLTACADSLLMWAHYADEHRGFVIEFDTSHPFFDHAAGDGRYPRLNEVSYVDERPTLSLEEYYRAVLFKSPHWSYEREWRMLWRLTQACRQLEAAGQTIHLFTFPPESVSGVILGCRAPEALRRRVADLLLDDPRYGGARLRFAQEDPDRYALRFVGEGWIDFLRACRAANRSDEDAVMTHLNRAVEIESDNAHYYYVRGAIKAAKRDANGARSDLERSVKLNPLSPDVWVALHELALDMGDRVRAIEAIDRALELERDNASLYRRRAAARFRGADYRGAIRDSTQAIAIEPNDLASFWRRASAHAKIGDWAAALEDTNRSITLDASKPKFHRGRAFLLRRLGDAEGAEAAERHARALESRTTSL